jgi:hypothetical protein
MEGMAVFWVHLFARRGFALYNRLLFSTSEQGQDRVTQAPDAGRRRLRVSTKSQALNFK